MISSFMPTFSSAAHSSLCMYNLDLPMQISYRIAIREVQTEIWFKFFSLQKSSMLADYLDSHLKSLITGDSIKKPMKQVESTNTAEYAHYLYDSQNYSEALKVLATIDTLESKWGILACKIMQKDFDGACDQIFIIKEQIEQISDGAKQNLEKQWLICWSVIVLLNTSKRDCLFELISLSSYLTILQSKSNFVVKYVAFALLLSGRTKKLVKDWIKVIKQEEHGSAITEFIVAVCEYKFHEIEKLFKLSIIEVEKDALLKSHLTLFKSNSKLFILENVTKVSSLVPIEFVAKMFNDDVKTAKGIISEALPKLQSGVSIDDKVIYFKGRIS